MGFLADEDTAIMWRGLMLNRAVQQFLEDAEWGDLDYLLIDLPPGTGDVQMGLARMLPRTELAHRHHAAGRRPEGRVPGRRHGPQGLPAGGRRDREHERLHLRARHHLPAVRRRRRRAAGHRDRGAAGRHASRSTPRSRPAATPGTRSRSTTGELAEIFAELARVVAEEVAPVIETVRLHRPAARPHRRRGRGRAGQRPAGS